jgi:uridine monophosphate synthetase
MLTYEDRAKLCPNPLGQALFELMAEKQTNLSIAADVTSGEELLEIAASLGSEICVLKTHIDIVKDFSPALVTKLLTLAKKHNFLIFEDRKFADIGNTVKLQYQEGVYQISDWAHIINAHVVPGPGIIEGLRSVGLRQSRGLLLIASMSSKGNLADSAYQKKCVKLALEYDGFVIGFIATDKLDAKPYFIKFMPGINLANTSDKLKQQYVSPKEAIMERGADVIIVGRGIYESPSPKEIAIKYRKEGWDAYQKMIMKGLACSKQNLK